MGLFDSFNPVSLFSGGGGGNNSSVGSGFASGFNSLSATQTTSRPVTATGGGVAINEPKGPITFGVTEGGLRSLIGDLASTSAASTAALVSQIGTLSENRQTGGDKSKNETMTWIVLLALAGVFYVLRKR